MSAFPTTPLFSMSEATDAMKKAGGVGYQEPKSPALRNQCDPCADGPHRSPIEGATVQRSGGNSTCPQGERTWVDGGALLMAAIWR